MKEPSRQSIWYAEQRDLAIEERDDAIARAEAAEKRVQELEARLADEWRPVTEKPEQDGRYLVVFNYSERPYTSSALYDRVRDRWQFHNEPIAPTHWRPLPPPPTATE